MEGDIKQKVGEDFLGVMKIGSEQKKLLFEVYYLYQLINGFLKQKAGLWYDDRNLAGVLGVLAHRNDNIDMAVVLGWFLKNGQMDETQDFFESFDFGKLESVAKDFNNVAGEVLAKPNVNFLTWLLVWLRYSDWRRIILGLAKYLLFIFIFFSLLYVLVATDLGRDVAWKVLEVYGVVVKYLLIILSIVALVVIVGIVSFMYFEGKMKKEKKK
ncbi:hypothetical protein KJ855_01980 [Patescibacteria group bacterium]|nr:hypothetical protein [Patescibacteria group bacterium]